MKKTAIAALVVAMIGTVIYCANILRKQEPFWGSVEVAAHTAGRRPCPPFCADSPRVERTWYGWNGKLVRKTLF
jgi:hypothetical protein